MGANSGIEWTDHTFNPWWGCVKISPACDHCYAESLSKRTGNAVWGKDAPRRFFADFAEWDQAPAHGLVDITGRFDENPGRDVPDMEFGLTCADLDGNDGAAAMARVGKKSAGALLDDREHKEFPTPRTVAATAA